METKVTALKKLPFDKGEFMANGKRYLIKNTLTVSRHSEFEKLQNHYGFGLSFADMYKRLKEIEDLFNKGKSVEAFAAFWNLKEGIAYRLEDRSHPALLLCSLFIVSEDEDLASWNEKEQRIKIQDWNQEGYDVNDFFILASNLVSNFLPIYDEIFRTTTSQKKAPK